jgi:hypothetical protein
MAVPGKESSLSELDVLQNALNGALTRFREELYHQNLPPVTSSATERHPLDEPLFQGSTRMHEARRVALGASWSGIPDVELNFAAVMAFSRPSE